MKRGFGLFPQDFQMEKTDKDYYKSIGESDRMTLKFKKINDKIYSCNLSRGQTNYRYI